MENCSHASIDVDTCLDCGLTFDLLYNQNVYSLNHTPQRIQEKSIIKELKLINIPENVKLRANEIFQVMVTTTKKGKKRHQLIFYCVYNAYKEMGITVEPVAIASMFGLKKNSISKAITSFSNSGYEPPNIVVSPVSLIAEYCERIPNLNSECIPEIEEFAREILQKAPELSQAYPQKIAAAIIQFYLELGGQVVDKKKFSSLLSVSDVTINNVIKEIKNVHNN